MNFDEAKQYLDSYLHKGWIFGLERVERLLDTLGRPQDRCRVILVAGTNGKGSVCAMLDSVLRASGYRVGLFTKPHLVDVRERFQINGRMITGQAFAALVEEIRAERRLLEKLLGQHGGADVPDTGD